MYLVGGLGIRRERGFSVGQAAETRPRRSADVASATARQLPDSPPTASRATSSVTIDDTYMMQLMGLAPLEEQLRHTTAKGLYTGYGYTPRDGSVPVLLFSFFLFFFFSFKPRDGSVYIKTARLVYIYIYYTCPSVFFLNFCFWGLAFTRRIVCLHRETVLSFWILSVFLSRPFKKRAIFFLSTHFKNLIFFFFPDTWLGSETMRRERRRMQGRIHLTQLVPPHRALNTVTLVRLTQTHTHNTHTHTHTHTQ
jgi:hypothetical protein